MRILLLAGIYFSIFWGFDRASAQSEIRLSTDVYKRVPFSSQFIDEGSLIRAVNYEAIKSLIPQIEEHYGVKLESRGEAHITVVTPPESQGWFTDHKGVSFFISPIELHKKYFPSLQQTQFSIVCIGKRWNKGDGNLVFYLVVRSPDLFEIRRDIQTELESRAQFTGTRTYFNFKDYWPHITIGFSGGDIHGVTKGAETCDPELELTIQ